MPHALSARGPEDPAERHEALIRMHPIIELADLHRVYRTASTAVHAVRGVNLRVDGGGFVNIAVGAGAGNFRSLVATKCAATRWPDGIFHVV